MRIRISYTVELTTEQMAKLEKRARAIGLPGEKPRELVRRLLKENGDSELYRDDEEESDEND